jgi:hypothetical protein
MSEFRGTVIIEWPAPARPGTGVLPGWKVAIYDASAPDAAESKLITTVMRVAVHASAQTIIEADVTMFADEDGNPVLDGAPVVKDGDIVTATFPFLVAEMRIAS